jgi:hypothetical protein
MDQANKPVDIARAFRIMHSALVAGVVLLGAAVFFLVRVREQALGGRRQLATILAAVSIGVVGIAAVFLRPRIPERSAQDSPQVYWGATPGRSAVIMLWAVTEGASLIGWVGYLLTGATAPALAAILATVVLIWYRPSRLEGAA